MQDIRDLLTQWGYWHRSLSSPIPAYQSIAGIIHRMNTENPDRRPVCLLSDGQVSEVECAVAALKHRDKMRFDLLAMRYIAEMSDSAIGAAKGISRATLGKELAAAEAWVDSRVFLQAA